MVRMLSPEAAEAVLRDARADGLGEHLLVGLAIGCPRHGNAGMDWAWGVRGWEVFCCWCPAPQDVTD